MLIYWACLSWFRPSVCVCVCVCVSNTGGRNVVVGCPVVLSGQWRQRWGGIQQVHAVIRMLGLYLLVGSAMQVNAARFPANKEKKEKKK